MSGVLFTFNLLKLYLSLAISMADLYFHFQEKSPKVTWHLKHLRKWSFFAFNFQMLMHHHLCTELNNIFLIIEVYKTLVTFSCKIDWLYWHWIGHVVFHRRDVNSKAPYVISNELYQSSASIDHERNDRCLHLFPCVL